MQYTLAEGQQRRSQEYNIITLQSLYLEHPMDSSQEAMHSS